MAARVASDYEELAFFALARVPVAKGVAPAVRASALTPLRGPVPDEVARPFEDDRAALAALSANGLLSAQYLPRLFGSMDAFCRHVARATLAELATARSVWLGSDLRLAELLACEMALVAPSYTRDVWPQRRERTMAALPAFAVALDALAVNAPALRRAEAVLSAELGRHGRGFREGERHVVYAGLPGVGATDEAALLALHEVAAAASDAPYPLAERAAVDAVQSLVLGTAFEAPYAKRLAHLDLSTLAPTAEAAAETARVRKALTR